MEFISAGVDKSKLVINNMAMVELDLIQVKGKTMPVHIHALLGDQEFMENEVFSRLATSHSDMISAYRRQDWKVAHSLINSCREINGEPTLGLSQDVLYSIYEERMAQFKEIPPGDDWDGVFVATIK